MERLSTFAFASLLALSAAQAQTSDIVVFSDMGEKFTLVIDGDEKNAAPAARVVATGIKNATPLIVVRFADSAIAPIKQNGWMEFGKEYTLVVTTNKKGVRVLRMQGQAELGTAAATEPVKPAPNTFVEDGPTGKASATQSVGVGGTQSTTTTTVTQSEGGTGDGTENVNMSLGVNGVGINMNVGVTDGTGAHTTSTTTSTTTVTNTSTHTVNGQSTAVVEQPVPGNSRPAYSMPGYNGPIGCDWPMSAGEFNDAKSSIESKGFEESKMTLAKQIAGGHCLTVDQVKGVMGLFGFEDSKLDFAKFAYDHTYDRGNYYKVNDVFGFESSIDDLNKYIQSR